MSSFPPTVILRHRKENLKKCSLRGLEQRDDFDFYTYPLDPSKLPNLTDYIMLSVDAEPLSDSDAERGLFVLDGTWRLCEKMSCLFQNLPELKKRSLPLEFRTAYPRRQEDCSDPQRGLASVEAIYAAYQMLGRSTDGLLDQYYWRDEFLKINDSLF